MDKLKYGLKMFSYIFYPGVIFILYLTQVFEGKMSSNLIFCPTDLVFVGTIVGIYLLIEKFNLLQRPGFSFLKNRQGKLKTGYVFVIITILVLLMSIYDDLKVYFYLNHEVQINILILLVIWIVLLGICFIINRHDKKQG